MKMAASLSGDTAIGAVIEFTKNKRRDISLSRRFVVVYLWPEFVLADTTSRRHNHVFLGRKPPKFFDGFP
jgi:hypothetical protein